LETIKKIDGGKTMKLFVKDYINDIGAEAEEIDIKYKEVTVKIGDHIFRLNEERGCLEIMSLSLARIRVYPDAGNVIRVESL
jgi:hypothetical protein